jgi:hypothetical protein
MVRVFLLSRLSVFVLFMQRLGDRLGQGEDGLIVGEGRG